MKRIGIIHDNKCKKVFLLPEQVKVLTSSGIAVNVVSGLGNELGINDASYLSAGATIFKQTGSVINSSDILLKVNAFTDGELSLMKDKVAITMANYLANVDMIFSMLKNNVVGVDWGSLLSNNDYLFFPKLEALKANFIWTTIKSVVAKGVGPKTKYKMKVSQTPKMFILNATHAGIALAKQALAEGYDVKIADNDSQYLQQLQESIKNTKSHLTFCDSRYDTLVEATTGFNIFVATTINPFDLAKLRVTEEMAVRMNTGSILIDEGCEYGYSFNFMKKFAPKEIKWMPVGKSYYLAPADFSEFVALDASKIISQLSIDKLIDIAKNGRQSDYVLRNINCENGKVINSLINVKLNLY